MEEYLGQVNFSGSSQGATKDAEESTSSNAATWTNVDLVSLQDVPHGIITRHHQCKPQRRCTILNDRMANAVVGERLQDVIP